MPLTQPEDQPEDHFEDHFVDGPDSEAFERFSCLLQQALSSGDSDELATAARVLGHLARVRGSMAAESVERELLRSLEWLEHPQDLEPARHRHAACLVITELAENAPTLLFVHIREVFGHLWTAVREARLAVREAAARALRACLRVVGQREHRLVAQWYDGVYDNAMAVIRRHDAAAAPYTPRRVPSATCHRSYPIPRCIRAPSAARHSLATASPPPRHRLATASPPPPALATASPRSPSPSDAIHGSLLAMAELHDSLAARRARGAAYSELSPLQCAEAYAAVWAVREHRERQVLALRRRPPAPRRTHPTVPPPGAFTAPPIATRLSPTRRPPRPLR